MQPLTSGPRVYTRDPRRGAVLPQQAGRVMRRDPAPSVWSYRMQRLWLTPMVRLLLRVGLPCALLALAATVYLADTARRDALLNQYTAIKEGFQNRPEFMVSLISIEGAAPELADAIRAKLNLTLPLSSFDIDLDAIRITAEDFDAVAGAAVRVRTGGVLEVLITERVPVLVWRAEGQIEMLDENGHRVADLTARTDRPDLPLIAGDGADRAAAEALQIIAAATPIVPRMRGLIRVGDRRWDIVLDRNQRIQLPQANPVAAVERLMALDRAEDLLARDVLSVDLRNDARPMIRLAPHALDVHRQDLGIDTSGSEL